MTPTITATTTEDLAHVANLSTSSSVAVQAMSVALPASFPMEGRSVPLTIERAQAYYWSTEWQEGVKATIGEILAGEFVRFDSDDPTDVARWLLSGEG